MDSTQGVASAECKSPWTNDSENKKQGQHSLVLGDDPQLGKENSSISSSSSSSSSSSEGDFFQIDPTKFAKPAAVNYEESNNSFETNGMPPGPQNFMVDNNANSPKGYSNQGSLPGTPLAPGTPTSPLALNNTARTGPMQSPPTQSMARPDTNSKRIPSSVFTRAKSTTPMEWSVASNESLFSIHMGNTSFSRDHAFFLGKSGEMNFGSNMDSYPLPPLSSKPVKAGLEHPLNQPGAAQEANAEPMKEVMGEKSQPDSVRPLSTSMSCHSDGSVMSFRSFAFPILTGDNHGSIKVNVEQQLSAPEPTQQLLTPDTPKQPPPAATPAENRWFPCC